MTDSCGVQGPHGYRCELELGHDGKHKALCWAGDPIEWGDTLTDITDIYEQ